MKNLFTLAGIWLLAVGLAGCTVRTYSLTRDRIDQDLSGNSGNKGYLMGNAPAETGERKTQRTTQVVEIEIGSKAKPRPRAGSSAVPAVIKEPEVSMPATSLSEKEPVNEVVVKTQPYKVKKGDTLQKISQKSYGTTKRWLKIYNANRDKLKAPNKIYPGQTINIPVEEGLKETRENLK